MVVEKWLLIFGVPIIVALVIMAIRKARALAVRIEEVRREMAANPQDPYLALAELFNDRKKQGKR